MSSDVLAGVIRFVVVDDAPLTRQMFRLAAQDVAGVVIVGEAADGAAALDVCRVERPAAVVLDVGMPVMNGVEAIAHLREALPEVKIAMFSGDGMAEAAALESGADAYFMKGATNPMTILEYLADLCVRDGVESTYRSPTL
jgi:DNA-binding NarL/FixJ family response regulator